jgi:hypothetical protein
VIFHGTLFEFTAPPLLLHGNQVTFVPREPANVLALLWKCRLFSRRTRTLGSMHSPYDGFFSIFFLTIVESGEWRPSCSLRPLNRSLGPQLFHVETLTAVLLALTLGYRGSTVDSPSQRTECLSSTLVSHPVCFCPVSKRV